MSKGFDPEKMSDFSNNVHWDLGGLLSPNGGTKMPKHVKRQIPQEFTIDHFAAVA